MSDAEALEAVAREALASMNDPDSTSIGDPRRAVVLYRCDECRHIELETTAGAVALPEAQGDALSCGARELDLATEGKAEACVGGCIPAAIRRAVMARDRGRCRVCGRRRYVDVHHLEPRSEGGEHSRENCCVLCTTCHAALHEGKLRIAGDAEAGLRWFDEHGAELGSDGGSGEGDEPRAGPKLSAEAARLLQTMDGRGGWSADALTDRTGLSASQVLRALMEMLLAGRVERDSIYTYAPEVKRPDASVHGLQTPDAPRGAFRQPPRGG